MISAISYDRIVANQIIDGGVDSVLYANFSYNLMLSLKKSREFAKKTVVLLMDNAPIHRHERVLRTAKQMGAIVLFNAKYSPWLNPIEMLFGVVKRRLTEEGVSNR